jgi:hypothetical protein
LSEHVQHTSSRQGNSSGREPPVVHLSGKLGQVTGKGLFQNLKDHAPRWLVHSLLAGALVGNTIAAAADMQQPGDYGRACQQSGHQHSRLDYHRSDFCGCDRSGGDMGGLGWKNQALLPAPPASDPVMGSAVKRSAATDWTRQISICDRMIIGQIFEREMAGHSPRSLGFGVVDRHRPVYRNIERVEKPPRTNLRCFATATDASSGPRFNSNGGRS